jgi:hypothetical protein
MAGQSRRVPMKREGNAAIRAFPRFAAITAKQRRRNPRRFRNRIVCSRFSRRWVIALRKRSDKIGAIFSFRRSWRKSTIRINGIWQLSTRCVSFRRRYFPWIAL